jgi:hypothetical protein
MASFRTICEAMESGQDFWDKRKDDSDLDERAMAVILRGLEIRPDRTDGNTFWDDFVAVLANNSENASHLLGVKPDVISRWSSKIRQGIKITREKNASEEDKKEMVPTGS